jgi:hypothetical protein
MLQTDSVREGLSRQTWYECLLCSTHQTISQPCTGGVDRFGSVRRYRAADRTADSDAQR